MTMSHSGTVSFSWNNEAPQPLSCVWCAHLAAERFPNAAWSLPMKRGARVATTDTVAESRRRLRDLDVAPGLNEREDVSLIASRGSNDRLPARTSRFNVADQQIASGPFAPAHSMVRGANIDTKHSDIRRPASQRIPIRSSRPWLTWIGGSAILVLSFFVTMRLTKPAKPVSPSVAILAASVVSDTRTLMAAIKAAGLKGAANVKGSIDEIKRLDDDRVTVKGWAADIANVGVPLTVMVFADGRHTLTVETRGAHAGVVQALGLPDAASATNVSFEGRLTCSRGQKLIVVALTASDLYGHFGSRFCP
jgi:hypothetical protein